MTFFLLKTHIILIKIRLNFYCDNFSMQYQSLLLKVVGVLGLAKGCQHVGYPVFFTLQTRLPILSSGHFKARFLEGRSDNWSLSHTTFARHGAGCIEQIRPNCRVKFGLLVHLRRCPLPPYPSPTPSLPNIQQAKVGGQWGCLRREGVLVRDSEPLRQLSLSGAVVTSNGSVFEKS